MLNIYAREIKALKLSMIGMMSYQEVKNKELPWLDYFITNQPLQFLMKLIINYLFITLFFKKIFAFF